ncbi:MAG TPA: PHP domain-containing protein [Planctomycetaceae bacterium]|jgi:DNA polymerase (family 10)|nr:PHP domain-containing protein [Planctomycetaceae bacterium]
MAAKPTKPNSETKAITNAGVAAILHRYAAVLNAGGEDRFKIKAYRRAAETIERMPGDVAELVSQGNDLQNLPGIGKAISSVIDEIVRTGKFGRLDETLAPMPAETVELISRPLLDPKRVQRIYKKLGLHTLQELAERLESGAIRESFGDRMELHVRQGLDSRPRMLLRKADQLAGPIEAFLKSIPGVTTVERTGSLRRRQETVGDLSFLVSGSRPGDVFERFGQFAKPEPATGERNRRSFRTATGQVVTLKWTAKKSWGLELLTATGAATHLHELEARARQKRISLSVKGLASKQVDASSESSVYQALGLPLIEPELREGRGEVRAAAQGRLPHLVRLADLKGDLHMHTTASDGGNSLLEMAEAARGLGYQYMAITDHSQSLKLTNGLNEKRLLEQIREIDKLNARLDGIVILKASEVDILENGSLDYPASVLKELDLTVCSIHSRFALDRRRQTERIRRAMDSRHFNILGHATGRLLLKRPGYDLDIERLVDHAKQVGCFFEINSNPNRLDLSDAHARLAKDKGVKIAINTDAHSIAELDFMAGGVDQARRAWLEPGDVLNAAPLARLRELLKR